MGTGLVVTDRDKGLPSAQRRGNCLGSSRWEPQAREAGCVESAGFRLADQPNGTGAGLRQRPTLAPLIALKTVPPPSILVEVL